MNTRLGQVPHPDPRPCQSCLNTRDTKFLGSWVADVVLGSPVGEVLRGFMEKEVGTCPRVCFSVQVSS